MKGKGMIRGKRSLAGWGGCLDCYSGLRRILVGTSVFTLRPAAASASHTLTRVPERGLFVGLQFEPAGRLGEAKGAHGIGQLIEGHGGVVQIDFAFGGHAERGARGRLHARGERTGLRQGDLEQGVAVFLLERGGDDEKDQEYGQDVDQGDDGNDRGAAFFDVEGHGGKAGVIWERETGRARRSRLTAPVRRAPPCGRPGVRCAARSGCGKRRTEWRPPARRWSCSGPRRCLRR
jgi:hypothetical protein